MTTEQIETLLKDAEEYLSKTGKDTLYRIKLTLTKEDIEMLARRYNSVSFSTVGFFNLFMGVPFEEGPETAVHFIPRKDFDNDNQNTNTQAVIAEKDAVITFLKKELLKKSYCRQVMKRQYRELKQKYEALEAKVVEHKFCMVNKHCDKCHKEFAPNDEFSITSYFPVKYLCKHCAEEK